MRVRRGYSLIELVMLIVSTSLILGLCAGILHALLKVDRSGRAHVAGLSREARLSGLLRADVRAARHVLPAAAADTLSLALDDDHVVEYHVQRGELVRVDRIRDTIRNQDAFTLPRGGSVQFEVDPGDEATLVRLVTAKPQAAIDTYSGRPTRIEAVLGQGRRFEPVGKSSK
jgi:hypothetical protein